MSLPKTKNECFLDLIQTLDDALNRLSCNDFEIAYTTENYEMLMEFGARNLRLGSVAEFIAHPEFESYKPIIVGDRILTQDFVILYCLEHELKNK